MHKPHIISKIEDYTGLQLTAAADSSLEAFMRYSYEEKDKNKYLLEGDQLMGLNLRTNGLSDFPFLSDPALHALRALHLSENKLTTIEVPETLLHLTYLDLSDNEQLREVSFAGALPSLKELDISDSAVEALALPDCPVLEKLDVSRNRLQSMEFTAGCSALRSLDLSGNEGLTKLILPKGFEVLTYLHLSKCGLEHLNIAGTLPALRVLDVKNNQLETLPEDIILNSPLVNLYAEGNSPKNIPRLFLGGDSLEEARTWFEELRDYPHEENKVVKLMLTGNGNVGKTTLRCALEHGKCSCEKDHCTTHGIQIDTWKQPKIEYNYWDFGGQEVYHGTHRLFLSAEALQLIIFDPATEKMARNHQSVPDRAREEEAVYNQPLQYWLETAQELSPKSQFLMLQNKMGKYPEEDEEAAKHARQNKIKLLQVDAKTGENIEDIVFYLEKHARLIPEYRMIMPASWLRVRQFFIDNLKEKEPERLISKTYFEENLCSGIQDKSRELLFNYLHHSGFLFYHENLGDQIIADQRWALEAIYKPLERSKDHYQEFREEYQGKIRVRRLFEEFGPAYTEKEKWLFLSFMKSCGLCFELNQGREKSGKSLSDVYVFPEFLPSEKPSKVNFYWKERAKGVYLFRYQMEWVHSFQVQAFIAALGRKTELDNIWRYGIQVYTPEGSFKVELDYDAKALFVFIEESAMPHWLGAILDEFRSNRAESTKWKISRDGGKKFDIFDREKWKEELRLGPEHPLKEEAAPVRKLKELKEVPQQLDREVALFMVATPATLSQINYNSEFTKIVTAVKQHKETRGTLEFLPNSNVSPMDMINWIDAEGPHILHFVGHGEETHPDTKTGGGLVFFSDNRREDVRLNTREAGSIFEKIKYQQPQLKLVFLNACYSEPQAKAISAAGLYAIGASDKIGSAVAEKFAAGFYHKYIQTKDIIAAAEFGLTQASAVRSDADEWIHLFYNGERISLFK